MRLAAVLTVLAATPGLAAAEERRPSVAIVPGLAVNLEASRVDALGQELANALSETLEIDAVGGLEVRRTLQLPPDGVAIDCLSAKPCLAELGKKLGVSQLLIVVMVDATGSGAVQIDSTWVDVASGTTATRPAIDLPAIAEARTRFAGAAKLLLPDAPVKPREKPTEMSAEVPRHFTRTTYALAGAAAVGLGVGVGFGLSARSLFNTCEAGGCSQSDRDSIRTRTIIADTGFVVGIGSLVAASIVFATSGKESRLVVSPSPAGVSLAAVGRF